MNSHIDRRGDFDGRNRELTGRAGRRRQSTRHRLLAVALTATVLLGAVPGVGVIGVTGEASAKPMQRDHAKYCAKLKSDVEYTRKAFIAAYDKYGPQDRLTMQAASNYDRAESRLAGAGC